MAREGEGLHRRWLRAIGEGEPYAVFVGSLICLFLLLSPFAVLYGQKWLNIYRFDSGGEGSRGTPPFRSWDDWYAGHRGKPFSHRDLKDQYKIAALKYPNTASCLKEGTDASSRDALADMDWDKLDDTIEAEVCVFRIFATAGNASYAAEWMQLQGLTMPNGSQVKPRRDSVGSLVVSGSWNIREKGYKHITGGLFLHLIGPPYAMRVYSSWTEDGEQLQYVDVGFKTK